ncbi:outer membrane beta-barrel protein [Pedobacter sp. ASV28]|uniref:outer membrane beta-barrel protein n=1 Tax=Pedobacter sp. ASV28 TaxID=2795123 RepID=UPI0018EDED3A|nr:outer membrane beta-barrel protein [Pedobacter sp. ASV28]
MKKLLLSLALIGGLGFAANAQTEGAVRKLSVGAEFGFPTGDGSKDNLIVGGSLQYEHPVAKSFNITGSAGYLSNIITGDSKKLLEAFGQKTSYGYIPVKAGGKYYFGGNFYGAAELGATFATASGQGTAFTYAPGLGASFSLADKSSLDFGVRYETWSKDGSSSFVGLRLAYAFGL